jgi:hypothetical protein
LQFVAGAKKNVSGKTAPLAPKKNETSTLKKLLREPSRPFF